MSSYNYTYEWILLLGLSVLWANISGVIWCECKQPVGKTLQAGVSVRIVHVCQDRNFTCSIHAAEDRGSCIG